MNLLTVRREILSRDIPECSMTVISYNGKQFKIKEIGSTNHLVP